MSAATKSFRGGAGTSLIFCGPAVTLYVAFMIVPAVLGFGYAFMHWNGWATPARYIGLENFRLMLHDGRLHRSIVITAAQSAGMVIFFTFGCMILAVLLDHVRVCKGLIRGLFFYPYILSIVVSGLVFRWLGHQDGVINSALRMMGLASLAQQWDGPGWAPWYLFAFIAWSGLGFFTMVYLANLQTIPEDLYEAARLDGAGSFRVFWHIQRPLLMPSVTTNSVMALIMGVNLFAHVKVLWDQPRDDTLTISTYIFDLGIAGSDYGYATAVSLVAFVALAAIALVQVEILRRREVQL